MLDNYFTPETLKIPLVQKKNKNHFIWISFFVFVIILLFGGAFIYSLSPLDLPSEKIITIPEGSSFSKTADILSTEGVIRSSFVAQVFGRISKKSVQAGVYQFIQGKHTLNEVLERLEIGDYGDVYVKITIPEGSTNKQIETILVKKIKNFDSSLFKELTKEKEGYLFPDTYLFLPDISTKEIVASLVDTFNKKTEKIQQNSEGKKFSDIVIMASLIEKEATRNIQEQKIVSGILWKRISKGMPLQVDAPFLYIQGKTSAQLSTADLRSDGPYNTYTRQGLTPTPIGNPGLAALDAALNPSDSNYYFYLHDSKGGIHYGTTHDDHVRNKQQYL